MTLFRFNKRSDKWWAFKMMRLAIPRLKEIKGCTFFKVLGSGAGEGFSILPDFGTYGILQVWDNESVANAFFKSAEIFKEYLHHSQEHWITYAKNISGRGTWSGVAPFELNDTIDPKNKAMLVITRATVRFRSLLKFWSLVPMSQKSYLGNTGLFYTKGVGEIPIVEMATYSLWQSEADLIKFARDPKGHGKSSKRAQHKDWFKESLFSRFQPYRMEGTWAGLDFKKIQLHFNL
ncbi:DUF3291 domain-containing protein [Putridiphycobacter roseus]|uniref:DUF3291 domain-containing protein n=2 Tax=Putridiphycobacter roseus TaxID=2219161 RepID=A0A2W1N0Z8_9FLAO|nr:DUF3291 domain-containing protein [Putridiphycobacter roseus]